MNFNPEFKMLDYAIFAIYAVVILFMGIFIGKGKKGTKKSAEDYFLAGKSLPWWAIGASLIAANISAEQFIGMSGSGFAIGLAIASYEWMAAITLIIVGKYFLPIFIKQGIYTIPGFVEKRFNTNLKTILAGFWIALYIFVNLTSVLYLGAKALDTVVGVGDGSLLMPFMIGMAVFALAYSIAGGLSSVAMTDVIQVILLVLGGLITTYIALNNVTPEGGVMNGFSYIFEKANDKFHMILTTDNPEYKNLPGIAVLLGGMWVANLYYWGFNQYIIQRTLAAKSLQEAQKGITFAAFLKLIVPLLVVIPGIIASVMYQENIHNAVQAFTKPDGGINYDNSYPWLIHTFLPVGLKGLVVAALTAAIVSSLASMINSTSTIFTMDFYKPFINKNASDSQLVSIGRITGVIALVIATSLAKFMGDIPQMFQYIQEYTGLVSPGILAVFLMGLFWKKTNTQGAIVGVLCSIPIALGLKILVANFPNIGLPFMDQMFYTLIATIAIIAGVSLTTSERDDDPKGISLDKSFFKTNSEFNIATYVILLILAVLYTVFW
ncbi:sodium/sugar symporter [Capnocytophaga catalasegens]|uniref:Transporter n=1 Tax=Capnocytophaga catalasegens TaxID=1004260 RepID=A0AAV5AWS6_9FLAO|nr:sodium/sugar symporter [Capnocytophaga catalasegens]GIZ16230.1 transporter [Capnocytophaga catalasegens]GJM49458.1 transporter [Capnocytophaga catalasegens]GJM53636.1 transporter [Capnocytophaga catalasegens]